MKKSIKKCREKKVFFQDWLAKLLIITKTGIKSFKERGII
jgi:hypothetical protein